MQAAAHWRHRHKRFHVRPEAEGLGYELFPGLHRLEWNLYPAEEESAAVTEPEAAGLSAFWVVFAAVVALCLIQFAVSLCLDEEESLRLISVLPDRF